MTPDISRLRQKIRSVEDARQEHVQSILQECGPIRSGSLVKIVRKCGKPNCHCAAGQGHPTTYLSSKEAGRTRMVYVSSAVEAAVGQQAQRYRHFRKHRVSLAKLARQSLDLADQLQVALQTTEPVQPPKVARGVAEGARKRQGR
jgi:hypothetical protein